MDKYQAAGIVFYKIEGDKKLVFLGLEGKEWRHFGGKIEEQDQKDPSKTIVRVLNEESEGQITVTNPYALDKIYDEKDKTVVYFKRCNTEFITLLNELKPTKIKSEYKWMEGNEVKYVKALDEKPKIAITTDQQKPINILKDGIIDFYTGYDLLCNSKDQYFLTKLVYVMNEDIIPIIEKYLEFGSGAGDFLHLFTINGFVAYSWYNKIKFNMKIDKLFQTRAP